jgi:hypothetical protein
MEKRLAAAEAAGKTIERMQVKERRKSYSFFSTLFFVQR